MNIRNRGWLLPVLAVGLWAFVAVVVGAIYPAVVQALKVSPAQSKLELPYITTEHRCDAGRVQLDTVERSSGAVRGVAVADAVGGAIEPATFNDIRLWDPDSVSHRSTYTKLQQEGRIFQFNTQALDRYDVDGDADAVDRCGPTGEQQQPAGARMGEHSSRIHPRLRDDRVSREHRDVERSSTVHSRRDRERSAPVLGVAIQISRSRTSISV